MLILLLIWNHLRKGIIQEQDWYLDFHHRFNSKFHILHWISLLFHCLWLCILLLLIVKVGGSSLVDIKQLCSFLRDPFCELNLKFKMVIIYWVFLHMNGSLSDSRICFNVVLKISTFPNLPALKSYLFKYFSVKTSFRLS